MITTHSLGFSRIGANRELKFALEAYWRGDTSPQQLLECGADLRSHHWRQQNKLGLVPVGDFSNYDHVLDMSFTLGHLPQRIAELPGNELENYFRLARGRSQQEDECHCVRAGEMTKWFDTNYHYIVPEFSEDTAFNLNPSRMLSQFAEAKQQGVHGKPVILGPVTYLWLGRGQDGCDKLQLLDKLLPVYSKLLDALAEEGADWVQIDEPILVTELEPEWQDALRRSYNTLAAALPKLLLTTYFGQLEENLELACALPVQGLHLDALRAVGAFAREEIDKAIDLLPETTVLSLGVINGRNIWKTDLSATLDFLEPLHAQLGERLWLAPNCSLLHVPVDLSRELKIDSEIKQWLAFALQKLDELVCLAQGLDAGRESIAESLSENRAAIISRQQSPRAHNPETRAKLSTISADLGQRTGPYEKRIELQRAKLDLPPFPTTTIGSFPQTAEIRRARLQHRQGQLTTTAYQAFLKQEITRAVQEQEAMGLDVLVHGEAERNDMVEYFGAQLEGFVFSEFGWVQSYGSRCVKPPILFGDISRPRAMTVDWIRYAQSLTRKPMKGMLTGPVTILNWSFVRDDQPSSQTCYQLALAIREEVLDLERENINIIQIDEAALREGLPLRRSQRPDYLQWAIESFRIAANGVKDETQIHTHMCYSDFNDIIESIAAMDADVITIETSRSNMELLDAFDDFNYPNEIGPGVYDIHSPNIPSTRQIVELMKAAAEKIPAERLWVNPDCGLKTRSWEEVRPALRNMVNAARELRATLQEKRRA